MTSGKSQSNTPSKQGSMPMLPSMMAPPSKLLIQLKEILNYSAGIAPGNNPRNRDPGNIGVYRERFWEHGYY